MTRAFVAIGANLGDARAAVAGAMTALNGLPHTRVTARSSLYRSAPVDASGPDFVNAVVEIDTALAPERLLAELHRLEADAGRTRPARNAPRTLDLDLLAVDGVSVESTSLTLPHPRMTERAFVLVPLAEIAPDRVTPEQLGRVSGQALERL
ncbi:MAG: 2-amino-4-hydroxy-6-hydroxymethyldihydropteridine diphosphokinase [Gammaproteobacteria bacterium]|nr:2-amino-4-hydroxy-6-hydroxymethyldihydropteridine diphosphokinase [Gammaproteobacteria bacterium]MBU1440761.1 2-amino-4-hydroxy-6-hydroxymethyldihydropteridine diphosphokinase [Gammaproteobacteria bacterium]MBU2288979.1 2-amino-4-hydroxy-6-hydroxymethyldihydropteridine diphosphokinase [Gammaproteobacteria bacterium]MBU2409293.1 2-amino-4-hydroxy-6-hydroxymethyldihydropteridine diphosphokinase [Gammaproteobacteria bacterium]